MQTQVEVDRRMIAADTLGKNAISMIRPRYNERTIAVQKAGVNMVVIFRADHGNESARGLRVLTLRPEWHGSPGKVLWVLESEAFIPTAPDAPDSSRKGSNGFLVPVEDDAKPVILKRPYCQPAVWWKGWQ